MIARDHPATDQYSSRNVGQIREAAPPSGEFWPQLAILAALITNEFWPHPLWWVVFLGGPRGWPSPLATLDALRAMVAACDVATAAGLRDRLLLVLGLALMGRRSELAALQLDDVTETPEGLEVRVRMSKTDQDAVGETIAIPRGTHPLTDPVVA